MSKNSEFVKFDKVDKSYDGKVLVVKDLNLDIAEGEFITMLGPSGSGKTTCLMMLAGFETPTNGEIYLDKNPISNIPPHKRGIGMVFQNYALFPHMTVYENLAFPLRVRKISKEDIDKMVDDAKQFEEEDKKLKEKIDAKNQLESTVYNTKNTLGQEGVGEKIGEDDKTTLEKLCTDTLEWIDGNPDAEKEEYDAKQKEFNDTTMPIMTKMYQGAGGAGGMPDMSGGMPDMAGGMPEGMSSGGPNIEEVD